MARHVLVAIATAILIVQVDGVGGRAQGIQSVAGRGVIAGRVIDAETRSPVAGASVDLAPIRDGETITGDPISVRLTEAQARTRGVSGPQRMTTERDGAFAFSNLSPGIYTMVVQHPSYETGGYLGYTPNVDEGRLRLAGDEQRTGLQVPLIKYGAITGRVTDETDDPEVGIDVRLLRRELAGGTWRLADAQVVRTNDRGEYRFTKLKAGDYAVAVPSTVASAPAATVAMYARATADVTDQLAQSGALLPTTVAEAVGDARVAYRGPQGRHVRSADASGPPQLLVYPTTFAPPLAAAAASVILLKPGSEATTDIRLAPVTTFAVSGRLRGPNGPAPRTGVRLLPDWTQMLASDCGFEAALTATDENGEFKFLGVPSGAYRVAALIDKSGWAPTPGTVEAIPTLTVIGPRLLAAPMGSASDPVFWASRDVVVGDRDVTEVDLLFQSGARFSGRVLVTSSGRGAATAPTRGTLTGLRIVLSSVDRSRAGIVRPTTIKPEGNFETPAFPPGRYFLGVGLPIGWRVRSAMANGQDIFCGSVDLRSADVSDAVLTLTPDETLLAGTVRVDNASGATAAEAPPVVVAFPADISRWITSGMNEQCARRAVAYDGAFVLRNMTPGEYLVSAASGAGSLADPDIVRKIAQSATAVSVREGRNQMAALVVRR